MEIGPGVRLGAFEVREPLGKGGMGHVFSARDTRLGRLVALKVISPDSLDHESMSRFAREARAASALNHPNIVTIHEVELDGETPFIAMELVEGVSLRAILREGSLSSKKIMQIAAQVADGLAAAHEKGIIHRDLKPENIMVGKEGRVKIVDFGLAKVTRPDVPSDEEPTAEYGEHETKPGRVMGTVAYLSPEQVNGEEIDPRSDQFAFGAILYEMATLQQPFMGASTIDTLHKIAHEEPDPIERFNTGVPAPYRWIVERCLSKDPEGRYASTHDLAREIQTLRDHVNELSGSGPWRGLDPTRAGPSPALWLSLVFVALVTISGGLWMASRNREPAAPADAVETVADAKVLALAPLRNLSGDEETLLLGDGMIETVGGRLSRLESIQLLPASVVGRTSQEETRATIQRLGATLVMNGAIQRSGDQLRVTWSLTDVATGGQVAGDTINGRLNDVFGIQDRLAESVAAALSLHSLGKAPAEQALGVEDQDRYLQAIGYLQRYENEASVDGAIAILEKIEEKRQSSLVLAALGKAYLYKFRLTKKSEWADRSRKTCETASVIGPAVPEVRITLGELYTDTGRFPEAIDELKRALAELPRSGEAQLALAEAYQNAGNIEEAEKAYNRAIELRPSYWGGYNKAGGFYLRIGRFEDAIERLTETVRLSPDNSRGFSNLGVAYQMTGRYDEAIDSYRRSLEIQPTNQGYSNLGTCYYFLGRYAEAAETFEHAVALTPDRYVLWANLGDAYRWADGRENDAAEAFDRAIELAEEAIRINSSDPVAHATLGTALAKRGRFEEAEAHVATSLELAPQDIRLIYWAAVVANLSGNENEAIRLIERAVAAGYEPDEIAHEPEFGNLKDRESFQNLVNRKKG